MNGQRWFLGEVLGTFLLVFFGCGSVATAVAFDAPVGLFQVAVVWGLGLAAAIYLTAHHSGAHLNPAVTLAFAVFGDLPKGRVPGYVAAQFLGAFLAAGAVFALFGNALTAFEDAQGIVRGEPGSEATAMVFGEFFPNPGAKPIDTAARETVPATVAFLAEFLGTLLLALAVFGFTDSRNSQRPRALVPIAIGMTLTVLICVFAPLSMAGFNPARDLAPRIFSAAAGWGAVPFSTNGSGWFTVYVLAPCLGALAGAGIARFVFSGSRKT